MPGVTQFTSCSHNTFFTHHYERAGSSLLSIERHSSLAIDKDPWNTLKQISDLHWILKGKQKIITFFEASNVHIGEERVLMTDKNKILQSYNS